MAVEARSSPRYPLHAELEILGPRRIVPAQVIDVSREGMFVATREPFVVGQSFEALLLLAKPLKVTCIVARILPERGIGIRYVVS